MNLSRISSRALFLVALAGPLATVACGTDTGQNSENATDSFSRPTEHGVLAFDAANPASFTKEVRFHSWTFDLTDEADVAIATATSRDNLDTVVYLYRKGEDGNWGRNIATNDDHGDGLTSKITKSLVAGEYRLKVKATKTAMVGSFAVDASCDGMGCPGSAAATCDPTDATMPFGGTYSKECDARMAAILSSPSVPADTSCFEDRAVAMYEQYWNEVYDYDEMADGHAPYVNGVSHGPAGTVVEVSLGGDEDAMDYVFDHDGRLIFWYQSNQSPDWGWNCPGTAAPEPDEDCATDVLYNHDYSAQDTVSGSGDIAPIDVDTIEQDNVRLAIEDYVNDHNMASSFQEVSYDYTVWSAAYDQGAKVTITSPDVRGPRTYIITGGGDDRTTLSFNTNHDTGETRLVCQDLGQ